MRKCHYGNRRFFYYRYLEVVAELYRFFYLNGEKTLKILINSSETILKERPLSSGTFLYALIKIIEIAKVKTIKGIESKIKPDSIFTSYVRNRSFALNILFEVNLIPKEKGNCNQCWLTFPLIITLKKDYRRFLKKIQGKFLKKIMNH